MATGDYSIRIELVDTSLPMGEDALQDFESFLFDWTEEDATDAFDQLTACADAGHLGDLLEESRRS
jgi:hypothetical protein